MRKIAIKGKPIVLSTGASSLSEIDTAIDVLKRSGCEEIALLHCILNYPTENHNAHLKMIQGLIHAYPSHIIGYSDHTMPDEIMTALLSAHLLGAAIIEKHFTHDKTLPGNDHYHAMDRHDLKRFLETISRVHTLLGNEKHKSAILSEEISRVNARRSIVLSRDVGLGHRLTEKDLTYKRPGTGISPLNWDSIIDQKTATALEADHILQWCDLMPKKK